MKNFHIATLASAGTGKTYSLVENYIHALFGLDRSGVKKRPHQILALTFTQKAAHEMRIRIAKRLTSFLNSGFDEALLNEAKKKHVSLPSQDEIRLILRSLPNASIATFHAFSATIIRQEALNLGIPSDFQILSPHEELVLAKNILRPLILEKLNEENPALRSMVARFRLGAGLRAPGLIEGIIHCYFQLFEQGVSVVDLSGCNDVRRISTEEIEERLRLIKEIFKHFSTQKLSPSTKERCGIIEAQLSNFGASIGGNEEEIATAFLALRGAVKGNFGDASLRKQLVEAIVRLGAALVDHFVVDDEEILIGLMTEFHQEFSLAKKAIAKLSYSDLLSTVRDVLRNDCSLRARLKDRFLHIMVDEYQDTSPIQEEIIALLAENKQVEARFSPHTDILSDVDLKDGASLFVVGDKKQSIYGFRGAEIELFDRMIKKMASTHVDSDTYEKRVLTTNYRSDKKIIEMVNLSSQHALRAQGYSQDDELSAHRSFNGHAELWVSEDDKNYSATESNLRTAAEGIRQLLSDRRDLTLSDITVLVRRIKSGGALKLKLAALGIPARIIGGEGFYQQQEIIDCLSVLQLLIDPSHQIASLTVLRSPFVLLLDNDIISMGLRGRIDLLHAKKALDENLLSQHGALSLAKFLRVMEEIKLIITKEGCGIALEHLIAALDLNYALGLSDNAEQKFHNLRKLTYLLSERSENFTKTITNFYRRIKENRSEPLATGVAGDDAVTIMTIHQSKGLEFKVTIVADTESSLPHDSDEFIVDKDMGFAIKPKGRISACCVPQGTDRDMALTRFLQIKHKKAQAEQEEMARLLYVALTRAQSELYVVSSLSSFQNPKPRTLLSLFLTALKHHQLLKYSFIYAEAYQKTACAAAAVIPKGLLFSPTKGPIRYFSSALTVPENLDFSHLIKKPRTKFFETLDGNLAHHILSEVGAQLISSEGCDEAMLHHLITASFRAQGIYDDEVKAKASLEACFVSLKALQIVLSGQKAVFEMPLVSSPHPMVVVEGFCDLVIDCGDFIGLIEFKSSYKLATHPDSYLQIFAYAMALKKYAKPIRYAMMLVGSSQIQWQDFDRECEDILLLALASQGTLMGEESRTGDYHPQI